MQILIVSDFHLGKGKFLTNGQINILEDFSYDDQFCDFLDHYSSGLNYLSEIHLVFNGDILNLIQVDVEGVFNHIIDDEHTQNALQLIYRGHKSFFSSIKKFLNSPNKSMTFVIGNHDAGMAFIGAQKLFCELIGHDISFEMQIDLYGVHIEHGHRFEMINTVSKDKYFSKGPINQEILNLPWGSLFCISLLPQLKKQRPYIDKIRPMGSYIKWCLLHDTSFFFKLFMLVSQYILRSSMDSYTKQNSNFKTTIKILKQITIYPKYAKKAKSILRRFPGVHTVVMGHTHLQEWRRFPEEKYYFNTGTWNPIPSTDAGLHQDSLKLTYCLLDVHKKTRSLRSGALCVWHGKWTPFKEVISTHS